MTQDTIRAVKMLVDAIAESVAVAGPMGAPGGVLYSAMMAHGVSFGQFEMLMSLAVRAGKVTKRGDLYFAASQVR